MPLSVSFTHDDFPKGIEFDIGLGVAVPNGGSVTLTPEQEEHFFARHQVGVVEYYQGHDRVKVSGGSKNAPEGGDD